MAIEMEQNGRGKIRKERARHGGKTVEKNVEQLGEKKENEPNNKREKTPTLLHAAGDWRAAGVHWLICFAPPAAV